MNSKDMRQSLSLGAADAPMAALLASAGRAISDAEKRMGLQTIKAPFLSILWLVHHAPGHAQGEYAAALHYDLATFGRHVESLVASGYITKTQASYDHRVMELKPTPAGIDKIHEKMATLNRMDGQIAEAMGPEDFQTFKALLSAYLRQFGDVTP